MGAARAESLSTLVSGAALAGHPGWRVFDCRHDLAKPGWGEAEYRKAHIPGAVFAHLDRDLSAPATGKNGRHPLPAFEAFVIWLGNKGVRPTDQIVCYDQGSGAYAARLWWMLRWVGHESVAVLDGGLAKWLQEGRPVASQIPEISETPYPGKVQAVSVEVEEVEKLPEDMVLLDARAAARYRGEQEPIDPEAGRIPGALNRFINENLNADGTFKSPDVLVSEFEKILSGKNPREIVHYCGSGVAACHNALAMEVAGLSGSRVYVGSWSEWIADPRRPRAKGPA
jgi:thiosulfate/3-mercaptopyruvate sulfurtransferase